jgi:hypothetical protein
VALADDVGSVEIAGSGVGALAIGATDATGAAADSAGATGLDGAATSGTGCRSTPAHATKRQERAANRTLFSLLDQASLADMAGPAAGCSGQERKVLLGCGVPEEAG